MKNELTNKIINFHKKARNKNRVCMFPNCNENAIESHILQKNGILNSITNKFNKLIVSETDLYKNGLFVYKERGINECFKFPGFCNRHDTELFKEIEQNEIDFDAYKSLLLFSIRACLNELRKKEIVVDTNREVLSDFSLKLNYNLDSINANLNGNIQGIKDFEKTSLIMFNDLFENKESYEFHTISLPDFVEICASCIFTFETTREINQNLGLYSQIHPTDILFHLIPIEGECLLIIGFEKERKLSVQKYLKPFLSNDSNSILKLVSDILIYQCESWVISHNFYNTYIKPKAHYINNIMKNGILDDNERRSLPINIFEI